MKGSGLKAGGVVEDRKIAFGTCLPRECESHWHSSADVSKRVRKWGASSSSCFSGRVLMSPQGELERAKFRRDGQRKSISLILMVCTLLACSSFHGLLSYGYSFILTRGGAAKLRYRIPQAALEQPSLTVEPATDAAPTTNYAEKVIDPEDFAAMLSSAAARSLTMEDDGGAPEPWEAMVDRIQFEGGQNDAHFRPPAPVPSSYEENNGFQEVDIAELRKWLDAGSGAAELWDVRDLDEFKLGHVADAKHVPFDSLAQAAATHMSLNRFSRPRVFLMCNTGQLSAQAQVRLAHVYEVTDVASVRGGLMAWEIVGADLVIGE